jgi:hypothetical protein
VNRHNLIATVALLACWSCVSRMDRARIAAQETAAIHRISTIHQAEVQYYSMNNKYAASLAELVSADILPKAFAEGKDGGYIFKVTLLPNGYAVTATPEIYGSTGNRSFYSDQTMLIRQSATQEPAGPTSPEIPR